VSSKKKKKVKMGVKRTGGKEKKDRKSTGSEVVDQKKPKQLRVSHGVTKMDWETGGGTR